MKTSLLIILGYCLSLAATCVAQDDHIILKNGTQVSGQLESLTDKLARIRLSSEVSIPGATASATYPVDQIDHIQFAMPPQEAHDFAHRSSLSLDRLEKWWFDSIARLTQSSSRTAAWGNAFASRLLESHAPAKTKQALAISDRILQDAWSEDDKKVAAKQRILALIGLSDFQTANHEAVVYASAHDAPLPLALVRHHQALIAFDELKQLYDEHPRWHEDEEVRPQRDALYHRMIDEFLRPHLFLTSETELAARGLASAMAVYEFVDEPALAAAAREDLIRFYPHSSSAKALLGITPPQEDQP